MFSIDIQSIGIHIQTGVAEAPAGEGVGLTQPPEVYAACGQDLLDFDRVLDLIRLGPWLQI